MTDVIYGDEERIIDLDIKFSSDRKEKEGMIMVIVIYISIINTHR